MVNHELTIVAVVVAVVVVIVLLGHHIQAMCTISIKKIKIGKIIP